MLKVNESNHMAGFVVVVRETAEDFKKSLKTR